MSKKTSTQEEPVNSEASLKLVKSLTTLSAGVIFLYTLISRIFYLDVAMGADEAMYLLTGKLALAGGIPYVDFYEMKPPGLFYGYAIIYLLGGSSAVGLHLWGLLISLLSTFYLYKILTRVYSSKTALLTSSIFFLLISSIYVSGVFVTAEHFVVLYTILALYCLAFRSFTWKEVFLAGLFYGLAGLTKQSAIFFAPVFMLVFYHARFESKKYFSNFLLFGFSAFFVLLLFAILIWIRGGLDEAMYFLYEHPKIYTSTVSSENATKFFSYFIGLLFSANVIPVGLALIGFIVSIVKWDRTSLFALVLLTTGFLSVLPGLRFYFQYWILLIPGLAFCFARLNSFIEDQKIISLASMVLLLTHLGLSNSDYFAVDRDKKIDNIHDGQYFGNIKKLSIALNKYVKKDDQLIVLGAMPQPYIYTGMEMITPHIWTTMLSLDTKQCEQYRTDLINDIIQKQPRFAIFSYCTFHWILKSDIGKNLYNNTYRQIASKYKPLLAIDVITGNLTYQSDQPIYESKDMIVVYEKR
jgi:hypothetical protein